MKSTGICFLIFVASSVLSSEARAGPITDQWSAEAMQTRDGRTYRTVVTFTYDGQVSNGRALWLVGVRCEARGPAAGEVSSVTGSGTAMLAQGGWGGNPTLVAIVIVVGLINVTGVPYATSLRGVGFIQFLLAPTVVLLAVPLFRQTALIRASGGLIASALLVGLQGRPRSLRVDNGPEFAGRMLDRWACLNGVEIDVSRPGKPTENGNDRVVRRPSTGGMPEPLVVASRWPMPASASTILGDDAALLTHPASG